MKNPFMSMWLSYANSYANMMRGFWTAEIQRQQTAMMNEMMSNMTRMWMGPFLSPPSDKSRSRK
jgi:hypothetical protein